MTTKWPAPLLALALCLLLPAASPAEAYTPLPGFALVATSTDSFSVGLQNPAAPAAEGRIPMETPGDALECAVSVSGAPREIKVLFFVDCEQARIVTGGETFDALTLPALPEEGTARETFRFTLASPPDPAQNHTLHMAVLLDTDRHAVDPGFTRTFDGVLTAYLLSFAPDNPPYAPSAPATEHTHAAPEDAARGEGLSLHTDLQRLSVFSMEPALACNPGETVQLLYQAGGGSRAAEAQAVMLTVGYEQALVNGQPYLRGANSEISCHEGDSARNPNRLVQTPQNRPVRGMLSFQAPDEPGRYEVMAWSVPDPFAPEGKAQGRQSLHGRFTLVVGE